MGLEFYRQILEKYSNIKFRANPSSGSRVGPCGRTDRHAEANKSFLFPAVLLNAPKIKSRVSASVEQLKLASRSCTSPARS